MLSSSSGGRMSRPVLASPDWYEACRARLPGWAGALTGTTAADIVFGESTPVAISRGADYALLAAAIPGARHLGDDALEAAAADVYASLLRVAGADARHPVRFWNFIPGIVDAAREPPLDRYMIFNAGRAAGYERVYRGTDLPRAIATASGVGIDGDALLVGCVAAAKPGIGIENPRQVPAYRYSERYGPRSPSFARGTIAHDAHLLIGGTAAVRGEDSVALDDVEGQLAETLTNLRALVHRAMSVTGRPAPADPLARLTTARIYVVRSADADFAREGLIAAGVTCPIETETARLCRPELLVEIEGTAALDDPISGPPRA
jgi:chorismate lyase/3-hydroxybenzoate synthase